MAEIKTRPATPEFRGGWDWIFGGFRPRATGAVIRASNSGDALFHRDSITFSDATITQHEDGVVYEFKNA